MCALSLLASACEGFWGKKTKTDFLDVPTYNDKTVAYVPIQPALTGFDNPTDVITGWDNLVYVVDSGKSEIIAFDEAGNRLGSLKIPGVHALAQDRQLELLALGTKDTLVGGNSLRLPAIYRISMLGSNGGLSLSDGKIKNVLIHPFCFNPAATPTQTDAQLKFTAVSVLADNRYYVSKTGPGGGVQGDAVVLFNSRDVFISPVNVSTALGVFSDYIKKPSSLTTFVQPPQSPSVSRRADFLFASQDPNAVLKVQGISFAESDNGAAYEVIAFPQTNDSTKADNILYAPYHFSQPSDITIAGDGTGYIWVTDAQKDSLYLFNGNGYEGANPPPGATSTKAVNVSFGGRGLGLLQFRRPLAVAYMNKVVYVADAGNKRVLRFKLTTDFR